MVTDPPAGIGFMGAGWDSDKGGRDKWIEWLTERLCEAFRVLKPGGHAVVWSLPKTSHWTGMALENAGFEIRDTIDHLFGSGFPKSANLVRLIGPGPWEGWGTALKPGKEVWWIARKPFRGTIAANVLAHGCGALNIDACRIGTDWNESDRPDSWKRSGHTAEEDADKIAAPPGTGIKCHPGGRWPANVVFTHSAGCICEGTGDDELSTAIDYQPGSNSEWGTMHNRHTTTTTTTKLYRCAEDCPVKRLGEMSGESLSSGGIPKTTDRGPCGFTPSIMESTGGLGDYGTASRFFNCFELDEELDDPFVYIPKPSTAEREAGCEALAMKSPGECVGGREEDSAAMNCPSTGAGRSSGRHNHHPTLKSIALMTHLIKLVTRPGGVVLSMFLGSGTDGCAAVLHGFRCIGIELEPPFAEIARARIAYWEARGKPSRPAPQRVVDERQLTIPGVNT
jgi:site-specific DNA-methyltransferase (adenine-specific)